jgi:hypothetical protein
MISDLSEICRRQRRVSGREEKSRDSRRIPMPAALPRSSGRGSSVVRASTVHQQLKPMPIGTLRK